MNDERGDGVSGRSHAIASGMLGVMVCAKWELEPVCIAFCIFGGLFPDIDTRNSYMGRFTPLWRWLQHRGATHSLLTAVLCSLVFVYRIEAAVIFFLGYLSHLLLDMCNVTGVPLWWPSQHRVIVARIRSGGIGELIVLFLFYIMVIALLSNW
jgi:inner membrane protein